MRTTLRREGDRVWLEGVRGWSPAEKGSSVHAAQAAVMEAVGEDVSYEYLVGVSGLAFRMQVSKEGLCPSSPHSFCGHPCHARSSQALPWELMLFEVKPEDAEGVARARQAVVDSIGRGAPVQYGSEEDGIIVGYQKRGQEWICYHSLREGGTETFVEREWPWGILVFTEPGRVVPPKRELAVGAFRQAVEMWTTPEAHGYHLGLKAWDAYLERLRFLQQADEETVQADLVGNSWIYQCLAQYRAAAARYLRDIAGEFSAPAEGHLRSAAVLNERTSQEVLQDSDHCLLSVAPMPWSLENGETWTREMHERQITRLEVARSLDREAIAEIRNALKEIA